LMRRDCRQSNTNVRSRERNCMVPAEIARETYRERAPWRRATSLRATL